MNKKEVEEKFNSLKDQLEGVINYFDHRDFNNNARLCALEAPLREQNIFARPRPLKYDDIRYGLKLKIVKDFYKGLKGVVHGRQKAKWFTGAKVHVTLEGIGVVTFTLDQVALDDGVSL